MRETVRDVVYLHNHSMVAAAQRKYEPPLPRLPPLDVAGRYVYIYDGTGAEVHRYRHVSPPSTCVIVCV